MTTAMATLADKIAIEQQMPVDQRWSAKTVYELLCQTAAKFPDRPGLSFQIKSGPKDKVESFTWSEIQGKVTQTANCLRALGVGDGHQVVIYDGAGLFSAARVWWLFRLMGQMDIAVLDGGLAKWVAEGREVEDLPPVIRDRHMMVRFQNQMVKDATQVSAASKLGALQIVDARSPARFAGSEPEPRADLRAGHIPGSRNVFYKDLLNANGTMKEPDALKAAFVAGGVDLDKPIITSCGSGITACILDLALERIGKADHAVYDGSWSEWGAVPTMPIETGEA